MEGAILGFQGGTLFVHSKSVFTVDVPQTANI